MCVSSRYCLMPWSDEVPGQITDNVRRILVPYQTILGYSLSREGLDQHGIKLRRTVPVTYRENSSDRGIRWTFSKVGFYHFAIQHACLSYLHRSELNRVHVSIKHACSVLYWMNLKFEKQAPLNVSISKKHKQLFSLLRSVNKVHTFCFDIFYQ